MNEQLVLIVVGAIITLISSILLAVFNKVLSSGKSLVKLAEEVKFLKDLHSSSNNSNKSEFKKEILETERKILYLQKQNSIKTFVSFVLGKFLIATGLIVFVSIAELFVLFSNVSVNIVFNIISCVSLLVCCGIYVNLNVFIPLTRLFSRENNIDFWILDRVSYSVTKNNQVSEQTGHRVQRIFNVIYSNVVFFFIIFNLIGLVIYILSNINIDLKFDTFSVSIVSGLYVIIFFGLILSFNWRKIFRL